MSKKTLIVAFGHAAQQGKDVAVAAIIEHYKGVYDVRRYAFADPLKVEVYDRLATMDDQMHGIVYDACVSNRETSEIFVRAVYGWSEEEVKVTDSQTLRRLGEAALIKIPKPVDQYLSYDGKVAWINENKKIIRAILQYYGTEFRRMNDPFYWIRKTRDRIREEQPQIALIPDMRFPNEAAYVKSEDPDNKTVRVIRAGFKPVGGDHPSEHALDHYLYDCVITCADGAVDELRRDAVVIMEDIIDRLRPFDAIVDEKELNVPLAAEQEAIVLPASTKPSLYFVSSPDAVKEVTADELKEALKSN